MCPEPFAQAIANAGTLVIRQHHCAMLALQAEESRTMQVACECHWNVIPERDETACALVQVPVQIVMAPKERPSGTRCLEHFEADFRASPKGPPGEVRRGHVIDPIR